MGNSNAYSQIAELLRSGCVFFLGSGFSKDAGMPNSNDLVKAIMKETPFLSRISENVSLEDAAQNYLDTTKKSKHFLDQIIHDELVKGQGKLDTKGISILKSLPVNRIITTNFDRVIENIIGELNIVKIGKNNDIPRAAMISKVIIYKLYGDLDDVGRYVLTRKDFAEWKQKESLMSSEVELLIAKYPLIVIGYSGRDPNFQNWLSEIRMKIAPDLRHPIYVVAPDSSSSGDIISSTGAIFIPANAGDFLNKLKEAYSELEKTKPTVHATVSNSMKDAMKSKLNPFLLFDADSILLYKDVEDLFYYDPKVMDTVLGPTNVMLSGSRGTGKSMILKYIAAMTNTVERAKIVGYVGIYLKWSVTDVIACKKGNNESEENWNSRFTWYSVLFILEGIIEHITNSEISAIQIPENHPSIGNIASYLQFNDKPNSLQALREEITEKKNWFASLKEYEGPKIGMNVLYSICNTLLKGAGLHEGMRIALLFDEYDRLNNDQRPIVSSLIAAKKPPILIKFSISSITLTEALNDFFSPYKLVPNQDYALIYLDETLLAGGTHSRFFSFTQNIINNRCNLAGIKKDISFLFPHDKEYYYSGFDQIVKMGSGHVRWPIEIVKDIFLRAVGNNPLSSISDPISPKLQMEIAEIHSSIFFQQLLEIEAGAADIETFLETLCEYFKQREMKTNTQRTLRFVITNRDGLEPRANSALSGAIRSGLIQVANLRRRHTSAKDTPRTAYRIHRILCPRFQLRLDDHHQREFSAKDINLIFEDRKKFVSDMMQMVEKSTKNGQTTISDPLESEVSDEDQI